MHLRKVKSKKVKSRYTWMFEIDVGTDNISNQSVKVSVAAKGKLIFASEKGATKVKNQLVIPANTTVLIK